jgi:hypothetical protein
MAAPKDDKPGTFDAHRLEMIRLGREVNARAGIPEEPLITAEELHRRQLAHGVRPEENIGSRELMRMRAEKMLDAHRLEMIRHMEEVDASEGITGEPDMTVEQHQQAMLAAGIRPEDNILSSEIIRMRYGDEGPEA